LLAASFDEAMQGNHRYPRTAKTSGLMQSAGQIAPNGDRRRVATPPKERMP
jgi:hypothetical protein